MSSFLQNRQFYRHMNERLNFYIHSTQAFKSYIWNFKEKNRNHEEFFIVSQFFLNIS